MSLVVAIDELKPDQVKRKGVLGEGSVLNSHFCRSSIENPHTPSAYLNQNDPGRRSSPHFHAADQFQIIVEGKCKFGRHDATPYTVHFTRAYTPYGPLLADKETGFGFMTLRSRYDPGQQRLSDSLDKLKKIPDRRPWQISRKVTFPPQGSGVNLQEIPDIKDEQGLFACALTMAPNTRMVAPDPSGGDGQFVVVVKGSLVHDNRERKRLVVAFVMPDENAFQIQAGAQGLQALILNLPQVKPRAVDTKVPASVAGFKKWQCALCSFSYDEALGMPEEGIPAGTLWQDVPETWGCPDCSASKVDFQMIEV